MDITYLLLFDNYYQHFCKLFRNLFSFGTIHNKPRPGLRLYSIYYCNKLFPSPYPSLSVALSAVSFRAISTSRRTISLGVVPHSLADRCSQSYWSRVMYW
jgi:hypothetical protein